MAEDITSYAGVVCNIIDEMIEFKEKSLIISCKHVGTHHNALQEYSSDGTGGSFSSEFRFINDEIFYKPPLKRHKNRIHSKQIAVVGGVNNKEKYVDDLGRVKINFFWNHEKFNDNDVLSCWVRLSQIWNGKKNGSMFIPSVGQEVLVTFINGDPDYPIVDGMLYNDTNKSKHDWQSHLNKWSITSRSSGDSNEDNYSQIMFDSTNNEEEVYLQSEKDLNVLVKHDETKIVKNNQHVTVGADLNTHVEKNHSLEVEQTLEQISNNSKEIVKNNKTLTISNVANTQILKDNMMVINEKNTQILKGDNQELFSSSSLQYYEDVKNTVVLKNAQTEVTGTSYEKVQEDSQVKINGTFKLDSQGNIQIASSQGISLAVGGNFITIDSSGVFISGSNVNINSGGNVVQAKEVPIVKVEKPTYNLLRVKSISGDTEEDEDSNTLNFNVIVERFENDAWGEISSLTEVEKMQINLWGSLK